MKVITLSGKDRSGKSSVGEMFANLGYQIIELSTWARAKYLADKQYLSMSMTQYYSENIEFLNISIQKKLDEIVIKGENENLVLVGVRALDLLIIVKNIFPNVICIYVEADFEHRFNRYLVTIQDRPLEPIKSKDDFYQNDLTQTSWGLLDVKKASDLIIYNNGSLEDLSLQFSNKVLQLLI